MVRLYCNLGVHLLFVLSLSNGSKMKHQDADDASQKEASQRIEVRAVFINCDTDETLKTPDSDMSRFQRQELFKHNSLRECTQKLALTVRLASEPADWASAEDSKSDTDDTTRDEYIPVDHVFEGSHKKRVRLLNPYILRLRRDPPVQAYKLRKLDIVSGVLKTHPVKAREEKPMNKRGRSQRDVNIMSDADGWSQKLAGADFTLEHGDPGRHSYSVRVGSLRDQPERQGAQAKAISKDCGLRLFGAPTKKSSEEAPNPTETTLGQKGLVEKQVKVLEKREVCSKGNQTWIRDKRHKQKYIPENDFVDYPHALKKSKNHDYQQEEPNAEKNEALEDDDEESERSEDRRERPEELDEEDEPSETRSRNARNGSRSHRREPVHKQADALNGKNFAMYEIGSPNLWYFVQLQLFEKMSTPEGKTVWNDLTNGEQASVSSLRPDWAGRDMTARYRPAEWVSRDDFALPIDKLCLLEPLHDADNSTTEDRRTRNASYSFHEYVIVPKEDIVGIDDKNTLDKRDGNFSDDVDPLTGGDGATSEPPRRVEVRMSRAIFGGNSGRFGIADQGADRFLTLPHQKPHRAQIDLEVRADENQLVRVGSSGSISTVVADNTRKKRTVLTLQATNTGLASARFRAMAKDCGPELSGQMNERGSEEMMTAPVLLPPQHTRQLTIELPLEIPVDVVHCSVALVNDDDDSVAVRDVAIRRDDRCFCVWHCDCVCLGEDPKLLCRSMSPALQLAAGLTPPERPRLARSACYADCVPVNLCVIVVGVILALLFLGALKATLGLCVRSIGSWGLSCLLRMPRKLERYYESDLQGRTVVTDEQGWPVHPDTCKRTVRIVSKPIEFVLNLIFFVALPSVLLWESISKIGGLFRTEKTRAKDTVAEVKRCFSSQDTSQNMELYVRRRKRRGELKRWMTPHAEALSTDLWQEALSAPMRPPRFTTTAQPLLTTGRGVETQSGQDSDQDDAEYVLTQVQKSRESLAKSQKRATES